MEKVTIQEASRRLNVSQRDIREFIRKGDLKAERDPDSDTGRWLVEMPGDEWEDPVKRRLIDLDDSLTRWWRTDLRSPRVHYLENMGIEEIMPDFLCGLRGENVFPSTGHSADDRCPRCLEVAISQGLPLWDEDLAQA